MMPENRMKAPALGTPLLELSNVTMQFGGVVAVNNFSMDVHKDEIVAIIGPNGAGKTTAFNVITGVYAPTSGAVSFQGETIIRNRPQGKMRKLYAGENPPLTGEVIRKTPDRITRLGIARTFQNIRLFKNLTVFENVLIARHMNMKANLLSATFMLNRREETDMRQAADRLLTMVGLDKERDEIASSLPYGMQRRLEIARALATEPSLLLLDEPAAGMNPQETADLTDFIRQLRETFQLTILMIEHHMNLVMEISDRIYVLDFGRLIAADVPEAIQKNQRVVDAYLGVSDDDE